LFLAAKARVNIPLSVIKLFGYKQRLSIHELNRYYASLENKALHNLDFGLSAALNNNFGFDKDLNLAKKKRKLVITPVYISYNHDDNLGRRQLA
jgi:hypothetical protein